MAFLRDLERLTAALMLMNVKPTEREARYREVLREVLVGANLAAPTSKLQLAATAGTGRVIWRRAFLSNSSHGR